MTEPSAGISEPGWYPHFNGFRFFDGISWTDDVAYLPPPPKSGIGIWEIAAGVAIGIFIAQFVTGLILLLFFGLSFFA